MGARTIPRPTTGKPNSPEDIFLWLEYLCLNSQCRGLAGYELAKAGDLLSLDVLQVLSRDGSPQERAEQLRQLLRSTYDTADTNALGAHHRAVLHLLGLSNVAFARPRPDRRQLAAAVFGMPVDTFQKSYEETLLRDVADELWRREAQIRATLRRE